MRNENRCFTISKAMAYTDSSRDTFNTADVVSDALKDEVGKIVGAMMAKRKVIAVRVIDFDNAATSWQICRILRDMGCMVKATITLGQGVMDCGFVAAAALKSLHQSYINGKSWFDKDINRNEILQSEKTPEEGRDILAKNFSRHLKPNEGSNPEDIDCLVKNYIITRQLPDKWFLGFPELDVFFGTKKNRGSLESALINIEGELDPFVGVILKLTFKNKERLGPGTKHFICVAIGSHVLEHGKDERVHSANIYNSKAMRSAQLALDHANTHRQTLQKQKIEELAAKHQQHVQTHEAEHERNMQTQQAEHDRNMQTLQAGHERNMQALQAEHDRSTVQRTRLLALAAILGVTVGGIGIRNSRRSKNSSRSSGERKSKIPR